MLNVNAKVREINAEVVMSMRRRNLKEDRFMDLTMFIVNEAVELDHDIAYCKLEDYRSNEAFNEDDDSKILYCFSEDEAWDNLFKITNTADYNSLHMMFKNARWCNWENLMLFELVTGEKYCALKL